MYGGVGDCAGRRGGVVKGPTVVGDCACIDSRMENAMPWILPPVSPTSTGNYEKF